MNSLTRLAATGALAVGATRAWDLYFCEDRLGRRRLDARNANRVATLETIPIGTGDTILLGDGVIAHARWDELFDLAENFGVVGDRSDEIIARSDRILAAEPARILLSVGTHDLGVGRSEAQTVKGIVAAYDHLIEGSATTDLIVTNLAPRRDRYAKSVPAINAQITRIAALRDLTVIDIHTPLVGHDGKLPAHLTTDGIHLTPEAYRLLEPALLRGVLGEEGTDEVVSTS